MNTIILMIIAYVLGSIPNALWIGKVFKRIDVREHGSQNTGSTNAARVLGLQYGLMTLILDVSKGAIPVYFALKYGNLFHNSIDNGILVGILAIFGHTFSVFLKFKGGKAVATTLGVFLILAPLGILYTAIVFFGVFLIFKYVSLASMISSIFLPIFISLVYKNFNLSIFSIIIGILILVRHRSNMKKILNKTETKFEFKRKKDL